MELSDITTSGDYTIQSNTCPASLNRGTGCVVTITFNPTTAGARSGTLLVISNDPTSPLTLVSLQSYGVVSLTLTKTVTPTVNLPYHGLVTYTLVLSNNSAAAADNTILTDTLPTEVDFARWLNQPDGALVAPCAN